MTTAQHSWGTPLPGAGPQRICICCGARETASSRDPQHPAYACVGPTELADYDAGYASPEYEPILCRACLTWTR